MNECSSIEATDKTNLTSQTKFQLDEISKKIILLKRLIIENHAVKKLSKYVALFDYIDQALF